MRKSLKDRLFFLERIKCERNRYWEEIPAKRRRRRRRRSWRDKGGSQWYFCGNVKLRQWPQSKRRSAAIFGQFPSKRQAILLCKQKGGHCKVIFRKKKKKKWDEARWRESLIDPLSALRRKIFQWQSRIDNFTSFLDYRVVANVVNAILANAILVAL